MIQLNLLPDVKRQFISTRRTKRRVILGAVMVAAGSLGVLVMLFVAVNVVQKQHLNNLNKDIKTDLATLESVPDLDKVLTIQNQLASLPGLHDQKPVASRFLGFLSQVTPSSATISSAQIDFEQNIIVITGGADTHSTVNKFVDTLKFTDYTLADSSEAKKAFSEVVLGQFGKTEGGVSYSINLKFDAQIFNNASEVKLVVPTIVTTRSTTEKPTELFQQVPTNSSGAGQ